MKILYRGSLISCNYGCQYCPFAKKQQSFTELAKDRQELNRFIDWIEQNPQHQFAILFTPWGEALIHSWYQQGLVRLTNLPNVDKAAIQTNLSCKLDWVEDCNKDKLALWATFHPEWVSRTNYLSQCLELYRRKVSFSAGVVGFPKFKNEIATLRQDLPDDVYLWINAVKKELPNMNQADLDFFEMIDPLFPINTHHYPSRDRLCKTGKSVISVNGDGNMRRCHFIPKAIGNIYHSNWESVLRDRLCTNETCHCHIGYVHLNYLELDKLFGDRILERIPVERMKDEG